MSTEICPAIRFVRTALPAGAGVLAVVAVGVHLRSTSGWTSEEMTVLREVSRAHVAALDSLALGIDRLFSPPVAAALVALSVVMVLLRSSRNLRTALQFFALVVIPWLGNAAIKSFVHRPRPDIPSLANALVLDPGGLSFPSGHTTFTACFVLGFIVVARGWRWRALLIVAGAMLTVATAWSRVYLGVHYPSDVIASIIYSISAVTLVQAFWTLAGLHRFSWGAPIERRRRTRSDRAEPYSSVCVPPRACPARLCRRRVETMGRAGIADDFRHARGREMGSSLC